MLKIIKTKVEYLQDPVGITEDPRFSWVLESSRQNVMQRQYHAQVSKDEAFRDLILDEKRNDDRSVHVKFGLLLQDHQKYYFRVKVSDDAGETSDWSLVQTFTTAFVGAARFRGQWIMAETEEEKEDSKAVYLRRAFETEKTLRAACVSVTAKGLYQLYLDGERVGNDELTPGWTSYHHRLLYQTYDVTAALQRPGRHCMGALLGAGWYKGRMGFVKSVGRNLYGEKTAFLAELRLQYEDGTEDVVATDADWQCAASPIVFSEIYDGEIYDAHMEIRNWCRAEESPTGDGQTVWKAVYTAPVDNHVLFSQYGCKVREVTKVPAKKIFTTPEGDTVIDFGQNLAGWIHMEVPESRDTDVIELDCFETLDAAGNVYTANLRTAKNRIVYHCAGQKVQYHPHFTYQGFRYAKIASFVTGLEAKPQYFTAYAVHSDLEPIGSFHCSDPDLNQLWHNTLWSLKSNFVDIPTDCPQRDERMGWTGDAQIFCRTAAFMMQTEVFFEKWLQDVAADQGENGAVSHVVPDPYTVRYSPDSPSGFIRDGSQGAAAWGDVAVLNPWNLYLAYGDPQILSQQYDSMKRWIGFMKAHADGCVWTYKTQYGDWVALDAEPGSYHGATPDTFTAAAYYTYVTGVMSKAAGVLGRTGDEAEYRALYETLLADFGRRFFNEKSGGMLIMTQTAHIAAIHFGLVPEGYLTGTVRELLRLLEQHDGHLVTGFVGTPYFCFALSETGHLKEAYDLLLKDDYPSWLYQVKMGATTIWEHWDGLKPDGTMWSEKMNSFNHYAYGSVCDWLVQTVAGIRQDEEAPGYRHAILYPQPGGGLTHAEGELQTEYGTLSCAWKKTEAGYEARVIVPANTSALFKFDTAGGRFEKELGSGQYAFTF